MLRRRAAAERLPASPTASTIDIASNRSILFAVLPGLGIERINLSIAAPELQQEFGLDAEHVGLMFSVFFWP